jgi:probable HAF family extracellular repeat protein
MSRLCRNSLLAVLILLAAWASAQSDSKPPAIRTIYPTFTTIDVPGAGYAAVLGINNNGDMVGDYGENTSSGANGFLYSNGVFTFFDYPGQKVTEPEGINDSGLIVGTAGQVPVYGFLYDGTTFTTLQDGTDSNTAALGINNAGKVVGGAGSPNTTKAFQLIGTRYKSVVVPGQWIYVYATGINNDGEIVGWTDTDGFECVAGTCQTFTVPGSTQTEAEGINDNGMVVGWYFSTGHIRGFALKNGKYLSFNFPGANTEAFGINNNGQIVGAYTTDDYNTYHGFVTSPITAADFR